MTFATLRRGRARISKQSRAQAERNAREIEEAAAKHGIALQVLLVEVFRKLGISMDAVFMARVGTGDGDGALEGVGLSELREALADGVTEIIESAMVTAGEKASAVWSSEFDLGFDGRTEGLLRQSRQRSATLVKEITTDTRRALRFAVARAVERGDNPRVAARALRPLVGNLNRHVVAVEKFREKLIKAGRLKRVQIDKLAGKYAGRLLKHRTEMIARTEMVWAANAAQHEYWQQLQSAGLIPTDSKRVWVVTEDDRLCPECAPLDGAVVEFNDAFESTELGLPGEELRKRPGEAVISDFPPLHPMCRCAVALQAGGIGTDAGALRPATDAELSKEADRLIDAAKKAEPDTTAVLKAQAKRFSRFGARMDKLKFRLKEKDSLSRKLQGDLRDEMVRGSTARQIGDRVGDALRYTMVLDEKGYAQGARAVLADFKQQGYKVLGVKKYWGDGRSYSGINTNLQSPTGGIFELQFHTTQSLIDKDILTPLYQDWRELASSSTEAIRISDKMKEIAALTPIPPDIDTITGRLIGGY